MNTPKTAQFYLPNKDESIALFYRLEPIKYNDNTTELRLQYLSTCGGGWMGSSERKPDEFIKDRLIKIE